MKHDNFCTVFYTLRDEKKLMSHSNVVGDLLDRETRGLLLQLLRRTFGSKVELVDTKVVNRHTDYVVLIATLHSPPLDIVVKLAGPQAPYPYPFDRTAHFHHLVATHTSIPMPDILAVDVSYKAWPWRYIIKTYVPGLQWVDAQLQMSHQELRDAYQQIGQAIAEMHSMAFPYFGDVNSNGTVPVRESYLTALTERAQQRITNPRLATLLMKVLDDNKDLFSEVGQARLCHEDLHGYNILFRRIEGWWRLATILDFDKAWAGHHESDLARLELWRGMIGEGFWPAYKAVCPVDGAYTQRRPIYQLFWCLEYAKPSPEHLADTRQVCKQLGIQAVVNFD
jgi:Ser/Thr protein kinase RdoA (MazF antagonist)